MNVIASLTALERLTITLEGLCRAVATRMHREVLLAAVLMLVWKRVRRVEGQIRGLMARFRAGRLGRRVSVARVVRVGGSGGRLGVGADGLPRGFAWLLPLVPCDAANFAGQVRTVLAEPEMVALLTASPQAGRVLRPLCRMLGIEASVLTPVAGIGGEPGVPVALGDVGLEGEGAVREDRADGLVGGGGAGVFRGLMLGVARSPPDG